MNVEHIEAKSVLFSVNSMTDETQFLGFMFPR